MQASYLFIEVVSSVTIFELIEVSYVSPILSNVDAWLRLTAKIKTLLALLEY